MKKSTAIILFIIAIMIAIAIRITKADAAGDYPPPRCYYAWSGQTYPAARLYFYVSNGVQYTSCYVTDVDGKDRSKGNGVTIQQDIGFTDSLGNHIYEGDHIYYQPTGELLTLTYKNDDNWGTGYYLMSPDGTNGYGLYNQYARTLIKQGVLAVPILAGAAVK